MSDTKKQNQHGAGDGSDSAALFAFVFQRFLPMNLEAPEDTDKAIGGIVILARDPAKYAARKFPHMKMGREFKQIGKIETNEKRERHIIIEAGCHRFDL